MLTQHSKHLTAHVSTHAVMDFHGGVVQAVFGYHEVLVLFLLTACCGILEMSLLFINQIIPLKKFYLLILFLAVFSLCCCTRAFSSCSERGYSLLWCAGFSLWWLLLLRSVGSRCPSFSSVARQLSSCGARA